MDKDQAVTSAVLDAAGNSMGWLQFIASLVGSLAWPVAAVAIAAIFHKQIGTLLAKVKTLKWGEAAVDFTEKLDTIEQSAAPDLVDVMEPDLDKANINSIDHSAKGGLEKSEWQRFYSIVSHSTNAAVLDSWKQLEEYLYAAADQAGVSTKNPFITPIEIAKDLKDLGFLDTQIMVTLAQMRKLRNAAAHDTEVTLSDAYRFQELADKVIRHLRSANAFGD